MAALTFAPTRPGDVYVGGLLGGPDALAPEDDVLGGSDPTPQSLLGGPDMSVIEADVFGDENSVNVDLLASPRAVDYDLLSAYGGRRR